MSASVINPVAIRELYKIRSPGISRRNHQNSISLARVKRDLFGPCNSDETKKFVERELAITSEIQKEKWGFDFANGQPVPNNRAQFQWEQLQAIREDCLPEMYTLTRIAHIRKTVNLNSDDGISDSENSSDELQDSRANKSNSQQYYEDEEHRVTMLSPPPSAPSGLSSDSELDKQQERKAASTKTIKVTTKKRQSRITEFLQERKRLATSSKTIRKRSPSAPVHQPSAKRMRVSIPGRKVD